MDEPTNRTLARRRRLLKKTQGTCFYCKRHLNEHTATIDHYIPKSRGGKNEESNMVAACKECNHKKGDRLPYVMSNEAKTTMRRLLGLL